MSFLYKKITSADSPLILTPSKLDAINNNQNALVLDVDMSGGDIRIALPSIASLLYGQNSGAGALSFYMRGTIDTRAVLSNLIFVPFAGDDICGSADMTISGNIADAGSSFTLFIGGRNRWGFFSCVNPVP